MHPQTYILVFTDKKRPFTEYLFNRNKCSYTFTL